MDVHSLIYITNRHTMYCYRAAASAISCCKVGLLLVPQQQPYYAVQQSALVEGQTN